MTSPPGGPESLAAAPAARWRAVLGWAVLVAVYLALRLPGLLGNSTTYDEPIYVGASMHWTALADDRAAAMLYHPPLAFHLIDVPLRFLDVPLAPWDPTGPNTQVGVGVLYGSTFHGAPVAPETVLLLARLPILAVGALGLWLMFLLGRRLGGTRAGWFCAAAWAVFPEAAAQSIQATTDCVAAVAAMLLAVAALRHLDAARGGGPTGRSLVVLGVAAGLALLSKHTLLVHVAVVGIALVWMRALRFRGALAVAGIAALVVWSGYLFEMHPAVRSDRPHETLDHVASMLGIAPSTLDGPARAVPLPAPTYLRSVLDALLSKARERSGTTWTAYMDGAWSDRGWWTWFPYAIWVKTPIVLLVLTLGGLLRLPAALRRVATGDATGEGAATSPRPGTRAAFVLVLALFAVPFAAAVVSRLNIGFRHLLPTLPFLFVVGLGAAIAAGEGPTRTGTPAEAAALSRRAVRVLFPVIAALLLWIDWAPAVSDPIPFANSAVGGPAHLHERLADSNLEIGQDLGRVRAWAHDHDVRSITALLHTSPGVYERECERDPRLARFDLSPTGGLIVSIRQEDQRGPVPRDGLLAVGESVLVLPRWQKLLPVRPLAQVGRTRIYVLPRP